MGCATSTPAGARQDASSPTSTEFAKKLYAQMHADADTKASVLSQAAAIASGESKVLDLSNTYVQHLPVQVLRLGDIEALSLSHCDLDTKNESFTTKISMEQLQSLKRIDLEANRVQHVPEVLFLLPKLEALSMRNNAITTLPPSLARLGCVLLELDLRSNFLSELPEAIGELKQLKLLSAGRNLINRLPDALGTLPNLQNLWLEHNRLNTIFDHGSSDSGTLVARLSFGLGSFTKKRDSSKEHDERDTSQPGEAFLPKLEDLNLHDNRMSKIPENLSMLPSLTWLSMGKNRISSLPASIFEMPSLRILHLQNNSITALPKLESDTSLEDPTLHQLAAAPAGLLHLPRFH